MNSNEFRSTFETISPEKIVELTKNIIDNMELQKAREYLSHAGRYSDDDFPGLNAIKDLLQDRIEELEKPFKK